MEELDCTPKIDDDTTTTTYTVSRSSSTTSTSSGFEDTSQDGEGSGSGFPIMELPAEIRCRIFNLIPQRQVPCLRLVSCKWRQEVDEFYEYAINVYDTSTKFQSIKGVRCRECTIWKLTQKLEGPLLTHPAYLKVIKVYGPASQENLSKLITGSTNLEQLIVTRRANYPWFLTLKDTPGLGGLTELRYLRLNSEEHVTLHIRQKKNKCNDLPPPPMMDCYFPKLAHFEILKRFTTWQYSHYVTAILRFVARHSKTLKNIELDLIPLSCIALLDDDSSGESESETDNEPVLVTRRRNSFLSADQVQIHDLRNLRLNKFCVTTKGADCDIFLWKSVLEKQNELQELRFDWLCKDSRAEVRARVTGFPWMYFQPPVQQSAQTLVQVELVSLSMFSPTNPRRVVPFDLGIFRECYNLKNLILRCRENHAKLAPSELVAEFGPSSGDEENGGNNDEEDVESSEVLLMINGSELPSSLEQLEINRFPMFTSDLLLMVSPSRIPNIRKLFIHECGRTGRFGVDAQVIRTMAGLRFLKFLEVIGFNDSGGEKRCELEQVFQTIGLPYEGQDTWLEFSDGSSSAYESLHPLLNLNQD